MVPSIEKAVKESNMIFVAAPTPHDPMYDGRQPTHHLPNKDFDYTIVKNILDEVNKYSDRSKLVVLISIYLNACDTMNMNASLLNYLTPS